MKGVGGIYNAIQENQGRESYDPRNICGVLANQINFGKCMRKG